MVKVAKDLLQATVIVGRIGEFRYGKRKTFLPKETEYVLRWCGQIEEFGRKNDHNC